MTSWIGGGGGITSYMQFILPFILIDIARLELFAPRSYVFNRELLNMNWFFPSADSQDGRSHRDEKYLFRGNWCFLAFLFLSVRCCSTLIYRKNNRASVSSVYPTLPPLWLLCFRKLISMRVTYKRLLFVLNAPRAWSWPLNLRLMPTLRMCGIVSVLHFKAITS